MSHPPRSLNVTVRPASPLPAADRCALLFGLALVQQGHSAEQITAQIDRTRRELERERVLLAERRVRYELSQESPNGH